MPLSMAALCVRYFERPQDESIVETNVVVWDLLPCDEYPDVLLSRIQLEDKHRELIETSGPAPRGWEAACVRERPNPLGDPSRSLGVVPVRGQVGGALDAAGY